MVEDKQKDKKAKKTTTSPDRMKKKKKDKKHKKDKKQKSKVNVATEGAKSEFGENNKSASPPIKLTTNFASNDADSGGWSWGAVFAAASNVRPDDSILDDDFIKATESEGGGDQGVMEISRLANAHKSEVSTAYSLNSDNDTGERNLKRNRPDEDDADEDNAACANSEDDSSLEGRMTPIPSGDGKYCSSLVLVDRKSGYVYSAGARTKDGSRLVIGNTVKGKIVLDLLAVEEMKRVEELVTLSTPGPAFPYPTNPDDHCETPLQSYKDILPLLNELCKSDVGGTHSMKIYDPYYCAGSVVNHLSSLGFGSVYNKKEDCYAIWKSKSEPHYDVLLTNPPYSEDHLERLMNHVASPSFDKPWLLLMPQWVHKKDFYVNATSNNNAKPCNPFYIVPKKRYVYLPPAHFREKKDSDVHKKSSPFVSMWYCWGGSDKRNEELMNAFRKSTVSSNCDLARSRSALRDLRRSGGSGIKGKRWKSTPSIT
ncbi:hypothetical protein ACHAW5_007917 [Stephanodiscus triporus]|uniref:Site-specific DNA-methyltransferase (adenine-specific) n=1 Tax=Stephanodiscus triporus TaxID=2934178 RepID=A0ABD3MW81_9STRA